MNARVRFEMNGNGLFAGGIITPFLKDAWFAWRYEGKQQAASASSPPSASSPRTPSGACATSRRSPPTSTSSTPRGTSPSPSTGRWAERASATPRSSAMTPARPRRRTSSRSCASSASSSRRSGLRVEGAFNYGSRANEQHRTTAKGLVGFKRSAFRGAAEYLWQERRSGTAAPDATTGPPIASGPASACGISLPKKASVFARFDSVSPKRGDADIGLPGAELMPYLGLANSSPFKGWIAGLELTKGAVRLSPNVEYFDYEDDALGNDFVSAPDLLLVLLGLRALAPPLWRRAPLGLRRRRLVAGHAASAFASPAARAADRHHRRPAPGRDGAGPAAEPPRPRRPRRAHHGRAHASCLRTRCPRTRR